MRAERDGKKGWIPLCKGDVSVVSTEWARLWKGEVMAVRERQHDVHYPAVTDISFSQSH